MFPNVVAVVMYTDGGPDHNCKHTSVRMGLLLALFLELDLDTMVVMRTAPTQSWGNPVERVMSVLNLGLQGVALVRDEMTEVYEKEFKKCNSMSSVRKVAEEYEVTLVERIEVTEEQHPQEEEQQALLQEEELQQFFLHENQMLEEEDLLQQLFEDEDDDDEEEMMKMLEEQEQRHAHEQQQQHQLHEQQPHGQQPHEKHLHEQEPQQQQVGVIDEADAFDDDPDDDVVICEEDTLGKSLHAHIPLEQPATNESICVTENPFITAYMKSILSARDTIGRQWSECTWDKKNLNIEAAASADEVNTLNPIFPIHIYVVRPKLCGFRDIVLAHHVLLIRCVDALVGQGVGQFEENKPLS
jgi:hypothetical protein